jgi:hypothetical protein
MVSAQTGGEDQQETGSTDIAGPRASAQRKKTKKARADGPVGGRKNMDLGRVVPELAQVVSCFFFSFLSNF